ncbi:TlpA disulfide reductase family protein [Chitinophaga cymbidii]|uniref:Thiol:disulfide interchange protein n=1 Tax=Chitinophaga cymbidii TaxID=1096750 RepID=A0A512RG62_9BACT|nr:TlpA disulfide reductase family protein [Chitinophaga cymbidii]GEP94693.1 thiol:disulfide interchange protein [Chitinophaga cymbidii]
MKKALLLFFILGNVVVCHAQFVLDGKMTARNINKIYLSYTDSKGARKSDSSLVRNGSFRFSGDIKEPTISMLSTALNARMDQANMATIVLEPAAMKVTIGQDDFKNVMVTGSRSHAEYASVNDQMQKIRARWQVVMDTLSAVNKRSNFAFQELKNWVLKPYNAEIDEVQNSFLKAHPTSYMAAYFLRVKAGELSADSLNKIFARFPLKVQQSSFGKAIAEELERKKKGVPGVVAPAIAKTDIDGKLLRLSDYKGKYVLLDFWASWCLPCRKGNPHLKELYAHYKSKGFEIIGVSDDDRKHDAWRKAVADDGIGMWKHVLRGLDMEKRMRNESNPDDLSEAYGIRTLPTKILIDRNGVIVGRYNGGSEDDAALDAKLAEVMP